MKQLLYVLLFMPVFISAQGKKISELPKVTELNSTDLVPVVQNGKNYAATVSKFNMASVPDTVTGDKLFTGNVTMDSLTITGTPTIPRPVSVSKDSVTGLVGRGCATDCYWLLNGNGGTTPGTNFIGTTDSKELYFKTKGTTAIVVDTNQNVGIGTATPTAKLEVAGAQDAKLINFYDNNDARISGSIYLSDNGTTYNTVDQSLNEMAYRYGSIRFFGSSNQLNIPDTTGTIVVSVAGKQPNVNGNIYFDNYGAGKTLISDANGNATWSVPVYVTDTSTIASLNLSTTKNFYSFSGTTATWTLPAVSGNTGKSFLLKNKGSGSITLNSNGGGNDIYNTSATNTLTITAGSSYLLVNDGTHWTVN